MKIALIHDHLTCKAGGEQVALTFHKAFPEAPIYTLSYNRELAFPEFKDCDIRQSWFSKLTKDESTLKKLFFPLGILAMRSIYLDEYDIVLISGTHCGKYVRFSKNTVVVNYCFTPFRLAWNPISYAQYTNSRGVKRFVFDVTVNILKYFDKKYAKRVDYFLAMTDETKERLLEAYNPQKNIEVINPPLNNSKSFQLSSKPKKYFLLVSRLEFYKKVDLAILAFNTLDLDLIIVGRGSNEVELKALATSSRISFKKDISTDELASLYSNCEAFIFPQHEDYGLTALEANAAGRPVIGYRKGGLLDTQIANESDFTKSTAILFDSQTVEGVKDAIVKYQLNRDYFDPIFIQKNAERFSEENFISKIKKILIEKAPK